MNGHNSRFISPTIPLHCLLAQDMANIIELYGEDKNITPLQWCKLELWFVAGMNIIIPCVNCNLLIGLMNSSSKKVVEF